MATVVYLKTCVGRRQSYLKLLWIQLPDFTKCVTKDVFCALVWLGPKWLGLASTELIAACVELRACALGLV
jgi:hypothetical protein